MLNYSHIVSPNTVYSINLGLTQAVKDTLPSARTTTPHFSQLNSLMCILGSQVPEDLLQKAFLEHHRQVQFGGSSNGFSQSPDTHLIYLSYCIVFIVCLSWPVWYSTGPLSSNPELGATGYTVSTSYI